jgi:5-methylcytosine-specific restriction endonuclease McrA
VETEAGEMNSKDNLVSLCRSCHRRFEGEWQELKTDEFIKKAKEEYYEGTE